MKGARVDPVFAPNIAAVGTSTTVEDDTKDSTGRSDGIEVTDQKLSKETLT